MRTATTFLAIALACAACASIPKSGALGEGSTAEPRISAVDTAVPPRYAHIELDRTEHVALLLVTPGHSAIVLFPGDSLTNNEMRPGRHQINFRVPDHMQESDSARLARIIASRDTTRLIPRNRPSGSRMPAPVPPTAQPYLLLVTSPQPLRYQRLQEITVGVSIPTVDEEALNAVGKAVKSTIANEPREWSGFFQAIELRRER